MWPAVLCWCDFTALSNYATDKLGRLPLTFRFLKPLHRFLCSLPSSGITISAQKAYLIPMRLMTASEHREADPGEFNSRKKMFLFAFSIINPSSPVLHGT